MGHSQASKAENHERIVAAAARKLREAGLDALSVADLMQDVGLTHGGFYKHFASREALVREAFHAALAQSGRNSATASRRETGAPTLTSYVRSYISRSHRDGVGEGCAMAALAADVSRAEPGVRAAFTRALRGFARTMGALIAPQERKVERQGLFAVSAMIGGLILSRAVDDEALSDEILSSVRHGVMNLASDPEP